MDPAMEPSFAALYDEARAAIVAGYQNADQCVLSFAIEQGISSEEVWSLIRDEASLKDDDAMEYLAKHPLEDRSWASILAEPATMLVGKTIEWAWRKWSLHRRQ
ncbi:MAG: hypothetical protein ABI903_18215 [Actinomycetota bacterium]